MCEAVGIVTIMQDAQDGIKLNNRDRSNICEIIVSHFLNKGTKLDNISLSKIADELIKVIPAEKKATYFVAPISKRHSYCNKSQVARGKRRNKLTALRRTLEYNELLPPLTATTQPSTNGKK